MEIGWGLLRLAVGLGPPWGLPAGLFVARGFNRPVAMYGDWLGVVKVNFADEYKLHAGDPHHSDPYG